MKKIAETKFNTEYPKIFVDNSNVFIADGGIFGKLDGNIFSEIIKFDKRFEIRNLSNIYFYLDEYSGDMGHLFSVFQSSFIDVLDFSVYELRIGTKNICLITNRQIPQTLLFDIEKKEVIWKHDKYFSFQILDNELLIDIEKNKIIRYNFQTGTPLWQYTLPEGEYSQGSNYPLVVSKEIAGILGVYESVLWIVNDMGHLIGLETETGKCKYHLKTPVNIPTEWGDWEVFIHAKKSFIDTEKGIIFGLDHDLYWECDLNNPTESYQYFDISESSKRNNITPDIKGNWLGDEIFFGQNSFAQDPSYAGIFNRQTRQITWTSRELGEEGVFKGINKVEYQAGRLYVLDRASTLHIFEREA